MKIIFGMILMLVLTSCGSMQKMIGTQRILQEKMKKHTYKMNPPELKKSLISSFEGWRSVSSGVDPKRAIYISDQLKKGFTYKGKFYAVKEAGLVDLINVIASDDKKSALINLVETENFFKLEESANGFIILQGNQIYKAKKLNENETALEIYNITRLIRGPLKLNVSIIGLLTKSGFLSISDGTILLDKVQKKMKRTYDQEFNTLSDIDEKLAKRFKEDASIEYDKKLL